MGFLDRLLGRGKQATGDVMNDPGMKREGMHQEQEGLAEERASQAEREAMAEREEAAEHRAERETT